ncbi:SOS response-associated peptidase [Kocuria sp. TGY1127_2]|uniref:SOS response-associated peptidase n=1 Tax=Kocuria sp. TGY1127_2 TaxID=2711328 RepID=UPI0015BC24A6|nr:SOS response-associated peptidase [Kocuria sp. TGY1127_2]
MCGRYVIARAVGDLLGGVELTEAMGNYNVAPTQTVPILVDHQDREFWTREIHSARWGLLPRWAKDESFSSRAFNARSETVVEKPTFRHAVKAQRCAVPANGYYEWAKAYRDDGSAKGKTTKTPYFVHPENPKDSIYFAGLYEWWKIPSGENEGQWLLSTTILTTSSPDEDRVQDNKTLAELSRLHDRLPIPLRYTGETEDELTTWLRGVHGAEEAVARIRDNAYDVAAGWMLTEVGREVGSVANNGPELTEPVSRLI